MIGVKSHAAKAIDAVERNRAAVTRADMAVSQHDSARPLGDCAEEIHAWKRERRDLVERAEACREAFEYSEGRANLARAEEAERAKDAAHAAAAKLVRVSEKLVLEIAQDAEKLAAKLAALEGHREAIIAANKVRGSREFIHDGEFRVRSTPGQPKAAITGTDLVWVDADGNAVRDQIYDEYKPGWIRNPAAVAQAEKEYVIREASPAVAIMPERLASAIRLVGLQGQTLWPR